MLQRLGAERSRVGSGLCRIGCKTAPALKQSLRHCSPDSTMSATRAEHRTVKCTVHELEERARPCLKYDLSSLKVYETLENETKYGIIFHEGLWL